MNFLAIDTSGAHLTVIAKKGENYASFFKTDSLRAHSVILMDAVEEVLQKAGLSLSECDFFGVCTGPGSFTGIRIGISAIKALSFVFQKDIVSVTALDCLAYNIPNERALAAISAGHGNYYVCGYDKAKAVTPPMFTNAEKFDSLTLEYPVIVTSGGGGKFIKADLEKGFYAALLENADTRVTRQRLKALYIKKSQAEEEAAAAKNNLR